MKYSHVIYDFTQGGSEEEWECALAEFGLVLTNDPIQEGQDNYGFFITKKKPTAKQLVQMVKEQYPDIMEDLELDEAEFLEECEAVL